MIENTTTRVEELATRRPDETLEAAAIRCATDAVYAARDAGGVMHDAGELAARVVLKLVEDDRG